MRRTTPCSNALVNLSAALIMFGSTFSVIAVANDAVYSHDASGNLKSDSLYGVSAIEFDAHGRAISYEASDALIEHVYDASGRRIAVIMREPYRPPGSLPVRNIDGLHPASTRVIVYSGDHRFAVHAVDGLQRRMIHGRIGEVLAEEQIFDGHTVILNRVTDHLGSTQATLDQAGDAQTVHLSWPFGDTLVKRNVTDEIAELSGLSGQPRDASGYDHLGARYYSSKTGRFLAIDPLATQYASTSPYTYVLNDPIKYIDPTGHNEENAMERLAREAAADIDEQSLEDLREYYDRLARELHLDISGFLRELRANINIVNFHRGNLDDVTSYIYRKAGIEEFLLSGAGPSQKYYADTFAGIVRYLREVHSVGLDDIAEAARMPLGHLRSLFGHPNFLRVAVGGAILAVPDPSDAVMIVMAPDPLSENVPLEKAMYDHYVQEQISFDTGVILLNIGVVAADEK